MRLTSIRNHLRPLRLARATWLTVLVLVALHPLSAAASGGSAGLAALLRELVCGCAGCAEEVVPEPAGCCEVEVPVETDGDCGTTGACACAHPDEVPLSRVAPIAPTTGDERAWLDATGEPRQLAAHSSGGGEFEHELNAARAAAECRPPPDRLQYATHARRAPATRERLAWLATALI